MRRFIPHIFFSIYHRLAACAADIWYGRPSRRLIVIGVTGTNGKTTVAHFITTILEVAGKRVGLISTIAIRVGGEARVNETKMTSLKNCWQIQRLLRDMVAAGDEYAVVETTSHALDQYRVHRVRYDAAVLTNITHEHLDYHKTLEGYRKAKERLFAMVARRRSKKIRGNAVPRVTVVNADDPSAQSFLRYRSDVRLAYGFGARPQEVEENYFIAPGAWADTLAIPGRFTVANALAAVALARAFGVANDIAVHALMTVKGIPGRLERIDEGQSFTPLEVARPQGPSGASAWARPLTGFTVMIDYAVTPDAFEKFAELVHHDLLKGDAKWWWVFGATGERDRAKRPILGAIAGARADYVVLTNEDPFHEDPERILDEVEAGVVKAGKIKEKNYWRMLDRRAAIRYALEHAAPGDVVTVTGKGAETAMAIGDTRVPWNERAIVKEILQELLLRRRASK